MQSLGIDSGSTMTKSVLFDGKTVTAWRMSPTAMDPGGVMRKLYADMQSEEVCAVVTTGYGRELLKESDYKITEITCHGTGAAFLHPGCDMVLDIGGQDCKAILLNQDGQLTDFLMNDKCAAGTGRFLEMILNRVGSDISRLDAFVEGCTPVAINSMCAVFAESEIVGLMAEEKRPGDIVLGCVHSICKRTAIFAQKLAPERPTIFFSGGLSQSETMRRILGEYLKPAVIVTHPLAPYAGAVGAAVLGYRKYQKEERKKSWN